MTYGIIALILLFITNKFRVFYSYKRKHVSLEQVDKSLLARLNNECEKQ